MVLMTVHKPDLAVHLTYMMRFSLRCFWLVLNLGMLFKSSEHF